MKSGNFSHWRWHEIFTKGYLQFPKPYHIAKSEKHEEKEKTNSGYKHNNKVSHGMFNLTFRMLKHTSSEVTVTKYDGI